MIKEFKTKYMHSFSEFEFNNSIFNNLVSIFHIFLETIFVKNIEGKLSSSFLRSTFRLEFTVPSLSSERKAGTLSSDSGNGSIMRV